MNRNKLNIGFGLVIATLVGFIPLPGLTIQLKAENFSELIKQNNSNLKNYENTRNNFSNRYPENWRINEGEDGAMFISPKESDTDDFQENIGITVQKLANNQADLNQIAVASLEQLKKVITDFNLVSSTETTLENIPAKQFVYTGKFGDFNVKWLQIIALEGDNFYIITYTAEASNYNDYLNVVEEMVTSFKKI